jgi:beta-lactamase superfamily II metal-dependent hydrolase
MTDPKPSKKRKRSEVERLGNPVEIETPAQYLDNEESIVSVGFYVVYKGAMARMRPRERDQAIAVARQVRLQAQRDALASERARVRQLQAMEAMKKTDDKAFMIGFIQMGQGDCCVIVTPGGKAIMIDCGTTSSTEVDLPKEEVWRITVDADWSDEEGSRKATKVELDAPVATDFITRVKTVLAKDYLLGNRTKIDYLILTHPDDDHYKVLPQLFNGTTITFGEVYHSNDLTAYSTNGTSDFIQTHAEDPDKIFRVIHNNPNSRKIKLRTLKNVEVEEDQEPNRGYLLLNEANCKIWFLAGDVTPDSVTNPPQDASNDTNRGSLVTLIETFGKKIMICGDATRITEKYLLATSGDAFKDLEILQAPHHGSDSTSSSALFVAKANPRNVAVSASRKDNQHNLPQQESLRAYFRKMKTSNYPGATDHEIFYWARGFGASIYSYSVLKRSIYTTGSQGSFGWKIFRDGGGVKMTYGNL